MEDETYVTTSLWRQLLKPQG